MTDRQPSGFGTLLRQRRLELGKSQPDIARQIVSRNGRPISPSQIGRWEAETKPGFLPESNALAQLAVAINLPVQVLVEAAMGETEPPTDPDDSLDTLSRWQVEATSRLSLTPEVAEFLSDSIAHARRFESRLRGQQG
jgi:transcriptional regulator with XRE-family HTH domain